MTARELFTKIYPVQDKELLKKLIRLTEETKYEKGDLLFKQDEEDTYLCFLKSGIVITSVIYPNGKRICLGIYDEPGRILSGGKGPNDTYSPVNIMAKTACEAFCVPMIEISRLLEEYPALLLSIYNQILIKEYEKQWQIKNMLYMESAEERYNWFLTNYPGMIDKVSHELIASFLRMSPVTLSRVRNKSEGNR